MKVDRFVVTGLPQKANQALAFAERIRAQQHAPRFFELECFQNLGDFLMVWRMMKNGQSEGGFRDE